MNRWHLTLTCRDGFQIVVATDTLKAARKIVADYFRQFPGPHGLVRHAYVFNHQGRGYRASRSEGGRALWF